MTVRIWPPCRLWLLRLQHSVRPGDVLSLAALRSANLSPGLKRNRRLQAAGQAVTADFWLLRAVSGQPRQLHALRDTGNLRLTGARLDLQAHHKHGRSK
jgi:hypothetical protein